MTPIGKGHNAKEPVTALTDPAAGAVSLNGDAAEQDLRLLRLFNHYRHDWMNDIQILMGYVQLKKYDKLHSLMEKIKDKVQQESLISKLGIPALVLHLLSFQAEVKELKLEVRLQEEIRLQELENPDAVAAGVVELLDCFRSEAMAHPDSVDQTLQLNWSRSERSVTLHAAYSGLYDVRRLQTCEERLTSGLRASGGRLEACYKEGSAIWQLEWLQRTDT